MKKLALNIFIFSFPLIICLAFFLADDPFSILYKNDGLAEKSDDIVKLRQFKNQDGEKIYSSYVFGNSRGLSFTEKDWQKYIDSNSKVFHFNAPGEAILNIYKKIEYITKRNGDIKNVIILIDNGILENTDNGKKFYSGPVYNHHPTTSNIGYLEFYGNYLKYYFSDAFFLKHILFKITKHYQPWMSNAFKNPNLENSSLEKNKINIDSLIETDFTKYKNNFQPNYTHFYNEKKVIQKINKNDLMYLQKIEQLLSEKGCKYYIIWPPDFHKQKANSTVLSQLKLIFNNHLFDFSGVNKFTRDSTLHYENLHFTKKAGKLMLDSIYTNVEKH